MDRSRFETLLAGYLDGALSEEEAQELDAILREAPSLRGRVADAAELHRLLEQELRGEAARAEGVKAVMRGVSRAAQSRARKATSSEVMSRVRRRRAATARGPRTWTPQVLAPLGAAAALVMAVAAAWLLSGTGRPELSVTGEVDIVDAAARDRGIARGALLKARREAVLHMGGYADVAMERDTVVRIEGRPLAERVYLRTGTVVCTVDGGREKRSFSVRTDVGTVVVTGTKFMVKVLESVRSEGEKEMRAKQILVKVLLGAVVVSGSWGTTTLAAGETEILPAGAPRDAVAARGKIEAGTPTYYPKRHKAWRHRGRIVGVARSAPDFVAVVLSSSGRAIRVDVEKTARGDRVYEVWLAPGVYRLRVVAEGYEPLQVTGLRVKAGNDLRVDLEFTAADEPEEPAEQVGGRIEAGRPTYHAKNHEAWNERGRIVGVARGAPRFEVTVLTSSGDAVRAEVERGANGNSVYEIWLKPGVYALRVVAEGYGPLEVEGLEVRAGNDLRVDLEFSGAEAAVEPVAPATGQIEAGRPRYHAKNHRAWREQGRIVGVAKSAPAFEVTVLTSSGDAIPVEVEGLGRETSVYEIWLRPGVYAMRVVAEGYGPLELEGLEVRSGFDLRIDLEFGGHF